METYGGHDIIYVDETDYPIDIDNETAEKLQKNYQDEITCMSLIQAGDMKNLEGFMYGTSSDIILGYSEAPLGNERAFAQRVLTISSVAAFRGGVDCTAVYSLIYRYQKIIQSLDTREKLISVTHTIMRHFCQTVQFQTHSKCTSPVIQPVLRYIHGNLHTKLRIGDVADRMHMNADYLTRLFKQETGKTFTDYVLLAKISFAKHMMETGDKSLSEISAYLAFSSQSHFSNVFKKYTGMTPKSYLMSVKSI